MTMDHHIAQTAQLISHPSRAAILMTLIAAKAFTAGEIAKHANISAQVASNQLKKLCAAKLVVLAKAPSKYRYYKLASTEVAQLLESLSLIAAPNIDNAKNVDSKLRHARSCSTTLFFSVVLRLD